STAEEEARRLKTWVPRIPAGARSPRIYPLRGPGAKGALRAWGKRQRARAPGQRSFPELLRRPFPAAEDRQGEMGRRPGQSKGKAEKRAAWFHPWKVVSSSMPAPGERGKPAAHRPQLIPSP